MRPQKQLFKHDPANGVWGDCHRTAIACMLDMDAKDVPHFMDGSKEGSLEPVAEIEAWLNAHQITQITIPFPGSSDLDDICAMLDVHCQGNPFILGGRSRLGTNHSVVCMGKKIICDPSQVNSGIVGPTDDGYYWITFFGYKLNREIL